MQTVLDSERTRRPGELRAGPPSIAPPQARLAYLDNLKLLLVALIIAGHGAVGYGDLENAWPYQEVQEVQLGAVANAALSVVVLTGALFTMGLFFLMSGLVTTGSLARRGGRTFARVRLTRLGVPLLMWTLVLWPGAIWAAHLAAGDARSFWWQLSHEDPTLDAGPMWFVEILLLYSLAFAAWRSFRRRRGAARNGQARSAREVPLSPRTLVLLAIGISAATVLTRLVFAAGSNEIGQAHLWQWPQYLALFGLGTIAAERGWLDPMPARLRRGCGFAALGSSIAFALLAIAMAATGTDGDVLFERHLHWAPLTLAAIEGPLAVGASLWLLGQARRHLNAAPGARGRTLVRSAYAAFMLQGLVLIALMIALRPVALPAEIKALAVAALGVAGSFALAVILVTRTPLGRIL